MTIRCLAHLFAAAVLLIASSSAFAGDAPDLSARVAELEAKLASVASTAAAAAASVNQTAFNTGDTVWVLLGAILVLFMTIPGLALFYGGLVRRQHVLGTMMQSLAICAVISVLWAVVGFSLAFGKGTWIGDPAQFLFMRGVLWDASGATAFHSGYTASVPLGAFFLFQLAFAVITPAVIAGAYAERMRFSGMLAFSVAWLFLVYCPVAHAMWGEGGVCNWAFADTCRLPVLDFAGGTVVETASGVSGLICALILGARRRYLQEPMPPHNLALAFAGAALLWFGWFGFNAGSALAANGLAVTAAVNTHLAACAATIAWPLGEWILRGKPTVLGAISGAVAGLVAITPSCGFVGPMGALAIGFIGGGLAFAACTWLKMKLKYDDSLDVFGVHGVAGMWGTIAIGLFWVRDANPNLKALNPAFYEQLAHSPIVNQVLGVLGTAALAAAGTALILLIVRWTIGIRVSQDDEQIGLDLSQHGEEAYNDRD